MNSTPPIVTLDDARPAGKPGECFYCKNKAGERHDPTCMLFIKTVVVRAIIEYPVTVPDCWTAEHIVFHRNDSSWCLDNGLREIAEYAARMSNDEDGSCCACSFTRYEVNDPETGEWIAYER